MVHRHGVRNVRFKTFMAICQRQAPRAKTAIARPAPAARTDPERGSLTVLLRLEPWLAQVAERDRHQAA